jgi:hypothetical protein
MSSQRERGQVATPLQAALVVLTMVLAAIVIGSFGHQRATLDGAEMEVVNSSCETENITAVTLRVTYRGESPIRVHSHSWDSKRHVQHPWEPRTITLEPGVNVVTIHSPRPRAGIGPGSRAQVYLNQGQRRVIENWEVRDCGT